MEERKYHLSYDVINCKDDFRGDYTLAKKYILTILSDNGVHEIECPCETTIVFTYYDNTFPLAKIKKDLKKYFYLYVSLISIRNNKQDIAHFNFNVELDENTQDIWDNI